MQLTKLLFYQVTSDWPQKSRLKVICALPCKIPLHFTLQKCTAELIDHIWKYQTRIKESYSSFKICKDNKCLINRKVSNKKYLFC